MYIRVIRGCFIRFELAKNILFVSIRAIGYAELKVRGCLVRFELAKKHFIRVIGFADLNVRAIRGLSAMLCRGEPLPAIFYLCFQLS